MYCQRAMLLLHCTERCVNAVISDRKNLTDSASCTGSCRDIRIPKSAPASMHPPDPLDRASPLPPVWRLAPSIPATRAMIGDGESQEGLVWEASMAAAHYKLDNLTVILDHNGLQIDGSNDEVMSLGDIKAKAVAFGYDVIEVADGNDMQQVLDALRTPACPGKPRYIILNTLKGKGVSFMEGQVGWHGKAPNAEQAAEALKELEG